jgi:hypothetical protein
LQCETSQKDEVVLELVAARAAARASARAASSETASVVTAVVVATAAAIVEVGPANARKGVAEAGLRGVGVRPVLFAGDANWLRAGGGAAVVPIEQSVHQVESHSGVRGTAAMDNPPSGVDRHDLV